MIIELVRTYLFIYKAFIVFAFGLKSNKTWHLSSTDYFQKKSFRPTNADYQSKLIALKYFYRTTLLFLKQPFKPFKVIENTLIVDSSEAKKENRVTYLKFKLTEIDVDFLSKEFIISYTPIYIRLFIWMLGAILFLPFLIISFVHGRRVNFALIFPESFEMALVSFFIKKYSYNKIHLFSPAEKDMNLFYLILKSKEITVYKHPSPGPLSGHNKNIACDVLCVSNFYHIEEIENNLKESASFSKIELWPPEDAFTYSKMYLDYKQERSNVIGFYSSATWLRLQNGITENYIGLPDGEEKLLFILNQYLREHPQYKLLIFLHPKEKKHIDFKVVENYYSSFLDGVNYSFADLNYSTAKSFNRAEVAIATYSTVLFERIYCGFKTLIYPIGINDFPLANAQLSNVSSTKNEILKTLLDNSLLENRAAFFSSNGLMDYVFFDNQERQKCVSAMSN